MQAEDFFPLGWLYRPFRRQPYPNMTYVEAINRARDIIWNIDTDDALKTHSELCTVRVLMDVDNDQFEGRSMQGVSEFGALWRGKVTTLLKTSEGTK